MGADPETIAARISEALSDVAPGCIVRVGMEVFGIRNIGIDLPRKPAGISRGVYLRQVGSALSAVGVCNAPFALGPRVEGHKLGQVRTSPAPPSTYPGPQCSLDRRPLGPDPRHAIRDALGLARLLWRVEDEGRPAEDLDYTRPIALTEIGAALAAALASGLDSRVARQRAGEALDRLVDLGWPEGVGALVIAARSRVWATERPLDERDLKRLAREARG